MPAHCFADDGNSLDQLKIIRKNIEKTTENLATKQSAEKKLLHDLSVVKSSIAKIDSRIDSIKREKKKIVKQIATAHNEHKQAKERVKVLSRQVNKRLVALYKEGETGPLKLFFSSASPMELVQQYQYLTRILEHDRVLLSEFRTVLEKQAAKKIKLERLQSQQKDLLEEEQQNKNEVAEAEKLYSKILKRVQKDKTQLSEQLEQLKARAQRLEQLIKQLDAKEKKDSFKSQVSFSALRGGLPWPVDGIITVGFGTQHNEALGSVLESHGIEITYRNSQPVKAVAQGRIVYASWFKGYGNLMIIAHDGGYHTLYAQIELLDKSIGDLVDQGDVIAETRPPGNQGLYFEIRYNGSPVDPQKWLKAN